MNSKQSFRLFLTALIILSITLSACSTDNPTPSNNSNIAGGLDICVFYGRGCPHCEKELSFLEDMKEKYPEINVRKFEVYFDQQNRELFEEMVTSFNSEIQGVPTTFIDDKLFVGFSDSISRSMEEGIKRCIEIGCRSPCEIAGIENISEAVVISGDSSPAKNPEQTELMGKITIPTVIAAAAVDAINPCAFAVLIILLSTILAAKVKKRVLLAGFAFSLSIFISYFLMGVGLYSAIQVSGLTHIFYFIVSILAIIIGLFNLKDYLWYGKWFIMEVPKAWRPRMKILIKGVTSVPGAFLIGFLISIFLLPCTSGPYIVILGLLSKTATRSTALTLLLLYNLIFIMPMIIITLAIYFGFTTTEKAEQWRQRKLKILHLIAGAIILVLGIGMLAALYLNVL